MPVRLVCTGEAYIFLRIPDNDPSAVLYYLSVPEEDVGPTMGRAGDLYDDNSLLSTTIGQLLAFPEALVDSGGSGAYI
ncbi:hypothetical protein POX_c04126 [Penicillium oxalicum]|uniref:hypothetical protein n=1 Tax=Penicillium oxalicum TaxID=69781 RepID=UPI0020B81F27|nr:hypothetical protein POX_c04126 [Penicillium oxalicum]KAI2791269.1 hypothetical protein POX_c04126 [Penicillium oxalicum]